jgi:hypothetical protein
VKRRVWLLIAFAAWSAASASGAAAEAVYQVAVAPLPDEDLAAECRYELTLSDSPRPVRGVWVTFDRGRDMLRIHNDPDVRAFARRHDLALLMPFHCRSKSGSDGDLNMDPSKGIGRALFAALDRFADMSGHRELASAKVILLGFSGTGSLVGRFTVFAPSRVLAVIATHPGHNPLGLDTIELSPEASAIPEFILAGSSDRITGTQRPYDYFRRYFDRGAPWTFVLQNKTPHCCASNATALMLEWLDAVVVQRMTRGRSGERFGFIRTAPETRQGCPNVFPASNPVWCHGAKDAWDGDNWFAAGAAVEERSTGAADMRPAGWLPTREFAQHWLAFVIQPAHPVTSLP